MNLVDEACGDEEFWVPYGESCEKTRREVVSAVLKLGPSTLFGLREDEAVLNGRCRVY